MSVKILPIKNWFESLCICLFVVSLTICTGCSDGNEASCTDGFPKIYSDQVVQKNTIDVYAYDETLTYVRTFDPSEAISKRTITLLNDSLMMDTNLSSLETNYEITGGCLKDFRVYERKQIDENCTEITIEYLLISVSGGTSLTFEVPCNKPNEEIIEETIAIYADQLEFDSVYVQEIEAKLSLIN